MQMIYIEDGPKDYMVTRSETARENIKITDNKIVINLFTGQIYDELIKNLRSHSSFTLYAQEIGLKHIPDKYQKIQIQAYADSEEGFSEFEIANGPIKGLKTDSITILAGMIANYGSYVKTRKNIITEAHNLYETQIRPYKDRYATTGFVVHHILNKMGCELKDLSDDKIQEKMHISRKTAQLSLDLLKNLQYHHDLLCLIN